MLWFALSLAIAGQTSDIRDVAPDLTTPKMETAEPAAGRRVKQTLPAYRDTKVYHALYLPTNWRAGRRYPILVELAGNGPYKSGYGDVSTGFVEGSNLGYGISAGKDYLWLCLPYLNNAATANVRQWWGDRPKRDPGPTLKYMQEAVAWVCREYGGDADRVVLCGFSRGAIACNYLGLHNDRVAKLWRAFVVYSHYDGVRRWGYAHDDRESAKRRLRRLGDRPQFICHEGAGLTATKKYLTETGVAGNFTFMPTGYRNHNDAWTLRPGKAREALRDWVRQVVGE